MQTIITILTVLNMYINVLNDCTSNFIYNADIENGKVNTMYVYEREGNYITPKLYHQFSYDEQGRLTEKTTFKWNSWNKNYQASHRLQMTYGTDGYELTHSIWGKKENDWKAMDEKTIYKCENGQLASVEYLHINQQGKQKVINSLIVSDPFEQLLLAGSANNGSHR